ncbi:MAG: hypothetical protein WBK26_16545 [Burkholderiaceae bacterium]
MDVKIDVPEKAPFEAWLAGAVMVALMTLGSWQAVQSLSHPDVADVPRGFDDIRTGVATEKLNKHLDNHLPARSTLIAMANAGRYLVFQGAGDEVRLGRDEWLFSVEELAYSPQSLTQLNKRVATVGKLSAELDQRGVKLVVALLPDKARVHAQQLSSGQYPSWHASRYPTALEGLRAAGVQTVDLLGVMGPAAAAQQLFYSTDTHWNQDGADVAAKAIAAEVHRLVADVPATQFATKAAAAPEARVGDLLRLMGLSDVPNWMRPNPDIETVRTTERTSPPAEGGLLDDAGPPVVLVGTSYSRRANFHGALQQHLAAEVLNVAKDGGGFFKSIHTYLGDEAFTSSPPKVLIWEIPERVLSAPDSDTEKQPLPL